MQKLVSKLSAAGLIESQRGTGGGFRLSRPPATISLADIVEAIEGPIAMTACVDHGAHDCCIEQSCRVKPHWNAVNGAVRGALAGVSLTQLSSFPREGGDPGSQAMPPETLDSRLRGKTTEEARV